MGSCSLDHLVITAPSLERGANYVMRALGVPLQTGGVHERMGTHNLLLRLGDALYLEVIAPNPNAAAPQRPRWFGLDALSAVSPVSLSTWVVRTSDIEATIAVCSEQLGEIVPMSRGAYEWLISVAADGAVPVDGVAPALIEWRCDAHPSGLLQDRGLSLESLEICHPDSERMMRLLRSIGLTGPVAVKPLSEGQYPHLVALINTPQGLKRLSGAEAHC